MNVSLEVVRLATLLSETTSRKAGAAELARLLGAEHLLLFIRDPEVNELLTAAQMPQTLPNGARWREFLNRTVADGSARGELSLRHPTERIPAFGVSSSADAAIVILGTTQPTAVIDELQALLPMLATACRGEMATLISAAQIRIADERTEQAVALAQALSDANDLLHEQAVELEAQAEELDRAREAADVANRAKSEFLTTMSHELRTPLNAISGYVQLLEIGIHGPLNEAQLDALQRVDKSQRHLLHLINEVLSLARIEAGGVDYDITTVDTGEMIRDLTPLIEPQAANKEQTLLIRVEKSPVVRADREKLAQVVLNLLSNAVKFTKAGGSITITADYGNDDASCAFITVADTGPGIPADKLESVFEPFIQVNRGPTRSAEGTGLGLSISRDLAHGMGGTLTVESTMGVGSAFTVTLPGIQRSS
ncbi:MAG TPA: HAMP domain-containing sensor histidine kinase [Longimicrobiales bacterium]|nr:HAMP domain-containing sensor histidine kinase [Longimicrobiales bacterium]